MQESDPFKQWHALLEDQRFSASSETIRRYLKLTAGLEPPTPYHIWSLISLFAALAGGRVNIDQGPIGKLRLNLGIVLIGFPAIRKSTAISVMQRFAEGLPLQYGPTDTAGQRQGIMAAMLPRWQHDKMAELDSIDGMTLEALASLNTDAVTASLPNPRIPPASELYFAAKELGRLLSAQSRELMDFFTDAIDGESIYYQLKTHAVRIKSPLINLLGATTPGSLGSILPRGATEHGFLSRLIFVYADRVTTQSPSPKAWNQSQLELRELMLSKIEETFDRVDGSLRLSEAAQSTYEDAYRYTPAIPDVRFQAYSGRRSVHLLKVAGILALMRGADGNLITASDIRLADGLLMLTERLMPRAFYGLDATPNGKILLGITELLESNANSPIAFDGLTTFAGHTAVSSTNLLSAIGSLVEQGKLSRSGDKYQLSTKGAILIDKDIHLRYKGANGLDSYHR